MKTFFTKLFLLFTLPNLFFIACKKSDKEDLHQSNSYVTSLIEYKPAPGQFINVAPGNMESASGILNKNTGLVSLGAWGGYITLGFDHSIINYTGKDDFIIYGNPLAEFAEPGVVWVMQDENKNGLADDIWYEIKGSEYGKDGYIRDYQVTYYRPSTPNDDVVWKDNKGNEGVVKHNNFYMQAYYPEWIKEDTYTLSGTLLPNTNIDQSNPNYVKSMPFDWGYADNTVGGDKIDIDNAIDKDGKKVDLKAIDFVKIQTGILADIGRLGKLSTEVNAVEDLNMP